MSTTYRRGFTIIETMLFLAISAILIVTLLAGTGTSINIQRYHDSVVSLQSNLQNQYFQVMNVSNLPPEGALTCNSDASVSSDPLAPPSARGRGDCVVIGRLVTITDTTFSSSVVVGNNPGSLPSYASDTKELEDYKLALLPDSNESSALEWGARIAWPVSGDDARPDTTPRTIAFLILRSPTSGLVYTFSSDSVLSNLHDMVIVGDAIPGQAQRRLCVDSNGIFTGGLAVFIRAYASNSSAVEILSNDMDDTSRC